MNNTHRAYRRRQIIQRRVRTQLNTIQNLVDDLIEGLFRENEPINHEDTLRLRRISTILQQIYENRGSLTRNDFRDYLAYQQRAFETLLSETASWHTCPSDNEDA